MSFTAPEAIGSTRAVSRAGQTRAFDENHLQANKHGMKPMANAQTFDVAFCVQGWILVEHAL